MSNEANKALIRRVYDAVAGQDFDVFDEIVSEDYVDHDPFPGMESRGLKAFRAPFEASSSAFSDFRIHEDDMVAEGDKVAARITVSGTHVGEFIGIPATNKSINVGGFDFFEIHDGKITARWGAADTGAMMEQLGLMG